MTINKRRFYETYDTLSEARKAIRELLCEVCEDSDLDESSLKNSVALSSEDEEDYFDLMSIA